MLLPDLLVKTAPLLGLHPRLEGEGSRGAAVLLQMGQGCLFFFGGGVGAGEHGENESPLVTLQCLLKEEAEFILHGHMIHGGSTQLTRCHL